MTQAERDRKYRANHPERIKAIQKSYYDSHRESRIAAAIRWRNEHPEKVLSIRRKHYRKYAERLKEEKRRKREENPGSRTEYNRLYARQRRHADPSYKILGNLRTRITHIVRDEKSVSMRALIGCSVVELREHLQSRFLPGMSWENYGAWHIDHIRPCASFDLTNPEQQRACFHWSNLQPLWAEDNKKKGASYVKDGNRGY